MTTNPKRFLVLFAFLANSLWAHGKEQKAWEKPYPENKTDLLKIQERLREILPIASKAVVAIESGDGAGSGVIVTEDGIILTAAHVIGRSGKRIKVRLPDGKLVNAITLGGSEISDAGMAKITDEGNWDIAKMAERGSSQVGDWCFALGHPGGFMKERGIVTRLGRVIDKEDETMRTDSRLLGGDSGGPLFDFEGKVIGIHSRIAKRDDQNYHAAIESYHANWNSFLEKKLITRESLQDGGFLGVACKETEGGLLVEMVVEGSAADKAGLSKGDLIAKVNGELIETREELTIAIATNDPGKKVIIEYRRGEKEMSIKVKLGSREEISPEEDGDE
jgi:serine protease Do